MAIATACKYTQNFTIIGNEFLNDEDLSADALGVLCYLRGKPADWKVMQTQLASRFKCGRERIARIIKELIGCGYMEKTQARDPATNKWAAVDYLVFGRKSAAVPETASQPIDDAQADPKAALRVSRSTAFPTLTLYQGLILPRTIQFPRCARGIRRPKKPTHPERMMIGLGRFKPVPTSASLFAITNPGHRTCKASKPPSWRCVGFKSCHSELTGVAAWTNGERTSRA
jgi:hypothetical protein